MALPHTWSKWERLRARCDAFMDEPGLEALGLAHIEADKVPSLDPVDALDDLRAIGEKIGERVALEHFGPFADPDQLPLSPIV